MTGVRPRTAAPWAESLNAACKKYEISRSSRRLAAFLGHVAQESGGLRRLTENLNYTPDQILATFKTAFKKEEDAKAYAHKPEAIANRAYANRGGNGDEASGDGWKYRGRGLIQLTGKDNYAAFSKEFGVDAVNDPDIVATPKYAALSAALYWKKRGLNELADAGTYRALSLRINRSLKHFPAREQKRAHALDVLARVGMADLVVSMVQGTFRTAP